MFPGNILFIGTKVISLVFRRLTQTRNCFVTDYLASDANSLFLKWSHFFVDIMQPNNYSIVLSPN